MKERKETKFRVKLSSFQRAISVRLVRNNDFRIDRIIAGKNECTVRNTLATNKKKKKDRKYQFDASEEKRRSVRIFEFFLETNFRGENNCCLKRLRAYDVNA